MSQLFVVTMFCAMKLLGSLSFFSTVFRSFAFWIASWNGIDNDRSVYEISLSKTRIQGIPRIKLLIVSRKKIFVINDENIYVIFLYILKVRFNIKYAFDLI